LAGLLDLVAQGEHRAGLARIAQGRPGGKDNTGCGRRENAGLPTELGWTMALAFDERREGGA
jgi:hypothetical protein